jgi:hypothetical protein
LYERLLLAAHQKAPMLIRKPFSSQTKAKYKSKEQLEPAWHSVESAVFTFTKKVKTRCGIEYIISESQTKKKLGEFDRPCGVCQNLLKGKESSLRKWSSTGYAPNG